MTDLAFFVFIFLSTVFWSFTILIDKHLVHSKFENYIFVLVCCFISSFTIVVPVSLYIFEVGFLGSYELYLLIFLVALFSILGYVSYFKAITITNSTQVAIFLKLNTIIVIILSVLFLGEKHGFKTYFGMFIVLVGVFFPYFKSFKNVLNNIRSIVFGILIGIMYALMVLIQKFTLNEFIVNPGNFFFWQYLFSFLIILIFAISNGHLKSFIKKIKSKEKTMIYPLLSQTSNEIGEVLWIFGLSIGSVSIASVVSSTTPIIVFILSVTIYILFGKKLLDNEFNLIKFTYYLISVILVFSGFIMIFYL